MSDYESEYSRTATRGRKRKQNRLLNLLIAVVAILILIVGYTIFFTGGGTHQASGPNAHNSANGPGGNGGNQGSASSPGNTNQNKKKSNQDTNATGQSADQTDQSAASGDSNQSSATDSTNDAGTTGPHGLTVPQGPWQPVGTVQQSPHQTSYDSNSEDWKEQLQALYEATGLTADNSTLWWLERDGAPDQSVGYLSPNSDKSAFYIVHIQWVDEKGWKPVKVERQYVKDPHAWYEKKKAE